MFYEYLLTLSYLIFFLISLKLVLGEVEKYYPLHNLKLVKVFK